MNMIVSSSFKQICSSLTIHQHFDAETVILEFQIFICKRKVYLNLKNCFVKFLALHSYFVDIFHAHIVYYYPIKLHSLHVISR